MGTDEYSTTVSITYFCVNLLFLIFLAFCVYKNGGHETVKSKSYLKDVWSQRKIYAPLLVHFYDTATDIGVILSWYLLMKKEQNNDDIDYVSVDMTIFFWTGIAFLLVYRILTLIFCIYNGCRDEDNGVDWYDFIFVLLDVYVFKTVYLSFNESNSIVKENAKKRQKKLKQNIELEIASNKQTEESKQETNTNSLNDDHDDEEEEEIEPNELQMLLLLLESIIEAMPQIILQSVFIIRSANDEELVKAGSNVILVMFSIIASLISISSKFVAVLDKTNVEEKAVALKPKAKYPKCIQYWYIVRVIWRICSIMSTFVVFVLIWTIIGGEWFVMWGCLAFIFWIIIIYFREEDLWLRLIYALVSVIGMSLRYLVKFHIIKLIENILGMTLITIFSFVSVKCVICTEVKRNNRVIIFLIMGWVSTVLQIFLFELMRRNGVLKKFVESDVDELEFITKSKLEKLELTLSLRKMQMISPASDVFIVLKSKNEKDDSWTEIATTDINKNTDGNPNFEKRIIIEYLFEELQTMRLDINANDNEYNMYESIGYADFEVSSLVTRSGQRLSIEIYSNDNEKYGNSTAIVTCTQAKEDDDGYDDMVLEFAAEGLPSIDYYDKISPFFQIYREINDGKDWAFVHKSEYYMSTDKPSWRKFRIEMSKLCDGDLKKPILVKCWDWSDDKKHKYTCEVKTTPSELIEKSLFLWKQWFPKEKRYTKKNCGQLLIKQANIAKKYSFTRFFIGGLQMKLFVAIDFTGSNGDPKDKQSLHYMGPPHNESKYAKVIKSVGHVLQSYIANNHIAAYGFGANINPSGGKQISHCFNLTLSDFDEVSNIDELIETYQTCLNKVQLYGPTYFSEILSKVNEKSSGVCDQNSQQYNIFLIITDGILNDMKKTIDRIVDADNLPLSIIIVGVGNADFSGMDKLQAHNEPLKSSKGQYMERNIVQFVEFSKFENTHVSVFAKEILAKVPHQFTTFMSMHKIHPNPKMDIQ